MIAKSGTNIRRKMRSLIAKSDAEKIEKTMRLLLGKLL